MKAWSILQRHYDPSSELFERLVIHSVLVARKAREIAERCFEREPGAAIDLDFLVEAALLHDIGIKGCNAPEILCTGTEPYIRHGVLGRKILEDEGLPRHALVCERHTGAGITMEEVVLQNLPIPPRDYLPISIEEKIICVADKFFSKDRDKIWKEKSSRKIEKSLGKYGPAVLDRWGKLRREVLGD